GGGLYPGVAQAASGDAVVLEDFTRFPEGWKPKGDQADMEKIYRVEKEGGALFLKARVDEKAIRIFKKISWNPQTHPVLTWKWRLKGPNDGKPRAAALYVSLDKDPMGIPTLVKYLWSTTAAKGMVYPGGFFKATEVIVQSGVPESPGWTRARIDALRDFRWLFDREPDSQAYGIGIIVDPGLEVDFSEIHALKP
ncbi:MAG: DUF3047 domain-containing protein, partial [Nitrospirae bacterium]|nr:DUF3047 domain-containing protein [Nitrospirota bacterium]